MSDTKSPRSNGKPASSSSKVDGKLLDALKHYDAFYEKPPPGLHKEVEEERPEDVIPDTPQNSAAREFLAKAPTKGLWMPLGKEVKVMKCWRCKNYGHRTGDKECPMFLSGNREAEEFRHLHEDPMYNYVKESEIRQKMEKVEMLKQLLKKGDKKRKKEKEKKGKEKRGHRRQKDRGEKRRGDSSDSDSSTSSSTSHSSSSSSSSSSSHHKHSHNSSERKRKRKTKHKDRRRHKHHKRRR